MFTSRSKLTSQHPKRAFCSSDDHELTQVSLADSRGRYHNLSGPFRKPHLLIAFTFTQKGAHRFYQIKKRSMHIVDARCGCTLCIDRFAYKMYTAHEPERASRESVIVITIASCN